MTAVRARAAAALTATLGLGAASWVVSVWQMSGMDIGVATRLGSFAFFAAVWVAMMAAMMLPGSPRRAKDIVTALTPQAAGHPAPASIAQQVACTGGNNDR